MNIPFPSTTDRGGLQCRRRILHFPCAPGLFRRRSPGRLNPAFPIFPAACLLPAFAFFAISPNGENTRSKGNNNYEMINRQSVAR
ncbi:MAG TPA: hypothetical protein VJ577_21305 [Burkholderiaceae bacterium]|nr:hypothetical protein [Burkholderiaceae bacterium]